MKVKSFDTALFRVPQFPINRDLRKCWSELKEAIKISSPSFFVLIENLDFEDLSSQSASLNLTIQKYFNRARFRATPYGLFADIGICKLSQIHSETILISNQKITHSFYDWPDLITKKKAFNTTTLFMYSFQANTLFYKIGERLRYIYKEGEKFELSELQYDQNIVDIINFCEIPKNFNEIKIQFSNQFDQSSLFHLVSSLVENQLLYPNTHTSIIADGLEQRSIFQVSSYIIGQRSLISGGLNLDTLIAIERVIQKLSSLNEEKSENQLDIFKQIFTAKYDQEFVPIMEALDPEIGIGYGGMERSSNSFELVEEISNSINSDITDDWLKVLKSDIVNRGIINKTEIELLEYLPKEMTGQQALPNTFNAIIRFYNNQPIIEQMGGFTANMILGRFSLADNKVSAFCKKIASIEQKANPDVLFFDLAYCGEEKVDNVNRREPIYNYQVDIYNYNNTTRSIPLNSILIGIRNGDVMLYSRELEKRIIPRLSSAYNYSRSDLPLFRLLCDLQGQGLKGSIIPDFTALFEDHDFIPQIKINGIILQPARWLITERKELKDLSTLRSTVSRDGNYRYIKIGEADQTLLLDTDCTSDLKLLLSILQIRKKLWLQDALFDNSQRVLDEDKNPYCSEFVLSFYHENEIYKPIRLPLSNSNTVQRTFLPGSEWLYLEIYSHTNVANQILNAIISNLFANNHINLSSWFFIRFDEGGDHIRLRFKHTTKEQAGLLIDQVKAALENAELLLLVKDFKICTYRRELERYGPENMERVEELFAMDSEYIYNYLLDETMENKYLFAIHLILGVGTVIFGDGFLNNLKQISKDHNLEHHITGKLFKMINRKYKDLRMHSVENTFQDSSSELINNYINYLQEIRSDLRLQMFRDLIHMHINRLFNDRQRIHEAIIYNHCITAYNGKKHGLTDQPLLVKTGNTSFL